MSEISVNCLNCRFCQLRPETDWSQKSPVIWCGQLQNPRIANFEGCPSGQPGRLHHFNNSTGQQWSAVADSFLRAKYSTAPMPLLAQQLNRVHGAIYNRAAKLGLTGKHLRPSRLDIAVIPIGTRRTWTAQQDEFLARVFGTDRWPVGGRDAAERPKAAAIVKRINALGPPHNWRSIKERAWRTTPTGTRRMVRRREYNKLLQRKNRKRKSP